MFASDIWRTMCAHAMGDEAALVALMIDVLDHQPSILRTMEADAARWTTALRRQPPPGGMQALLRQFPLGTPEATALMRLAEVLPRLRDNRVADALIRDLLRPIDWQAPVRGDTRQTAGATRLLSLASRWLRHGAAPAERLRQLAASVSDPLIRRGIRHGAEQLATHYVLGTSLPAALRSARRDWADGQTHSFDLLGEAALTAEEARHHRHAYREAVDVLARAELPAGIPRPSLSVKLSALYPRYEAQHAQAMQTDLLPWLVTLVEQAAAAEVAVTIDAEEADRFELGLALFERALAALPAAARPTLGIALQAYGKRAWHALPWLAAVAERYQTRIPLRLVKGAYWDSEIKRAQQRGLADYPVFTSKRNTDIAWLACARWLLTRTDQFQPQFATHNALSIAAVLQTAHGLDIQPETYEFQRLLGMGDELYRQVRQEQPRLRLRIYAPVGSHRDLLPYLVRRLLENGANSSFVRRLHDESAPVEELTRHPLQLPPERTPLPSPAALYHPWRANSRGVWLAAEADRIPFLHELNAFRADHQESDAPAAVAVTSPFDGEPVGSWQPTPTTAIPDLLTRAQEGFGEWSALSAVHRCALLERVAARIEEQRAELVAMVARETGKPLADAIDEVREAADFCRYYGRQAATLMESALPLPGPTGESNQLRYAPRGLFLCVSPWNFPVAIFAGQIAAALAAGNAVIAKPAEQATLCAELTTRLFHEAGVPPAALQLARGGGEQVGAALCRAEAIAGIAFTGGWETARAINRTLAARDGPLVPLVAETGGINALIADASAYPPQLVSDVLRSAFNSAGQRCSALRLLFLPTAIADEVERLLGSALQTLVIGDPLDWATDVGPVIDSDARLRLNAYIEGWEQRGRLLARATAPARGCFVGPAIIRLEAPTELQAEWFGPVLHLVRYRDVDEAISWVNASGFGLTAGIHSRNEAQALRWAERLRVGNCYINRDIIGATVGSQPFGGEARSGTGFKAGGPNYLLRFVVERTLTLNTAAWGGDQRLLGASSPIP